MGKIEILEKMRILNVYLWIVVNCVAGASIGFLVTDPSILSVWDIICIIAWCISIKIICEHGTQESKGYYNDLIWLIKEGKYEKGELKRMALYIWAKRMTFYLWVAINFFASILIGITVVWYIADIYTVGSISAFHIVCSIIYAIAWSMSIKVITEYGR
jgi:hypothetical protein